MTASKHRLETLNDGVFAIIITIMVMGIQLPQTDQLPAIKPFIKDIFIFLVSFILIGMFWNRHRRWFEHLERVNEKLIWRNLLFLSILSVIPLFTKWVMQYPGATAPVAGYGVVYLLANLSFNFSFAGALPLCEPGVREIIEQRKRQPYLGVILATSGILLIITGAFFFPRISTIFLIGYPIISAVLNMWFEDDEMMRKKRMMHKRGIIRK